MEQNQIAISVEMIKNNSIKLDTDWRTKANCLGIETEEFFAEKTSYANRPLLERICNNCDVQVECLAFALKHDTIGWWAGTTDHSRRPIRRAMGLGEVTLDDWLPVRKARTEVQYSTEEDYLR